MYNIKKYIKDNGLFDFEEVEKSISCRIFYSRAIRTLCVLNDEFDEEMNQIVPSAIFYAGKMCLYDIWKSNITGGYETIYFEYRYDEQGKINIYFHLDWEPPFMSEDDPAIIDCWI